MNNDEPNKVWLNDGNGNFSDSGQALGNSASAFVDLGDVDGDGDLDAFVVNGVRVKNSNRVWFNDGSGVFSDSGQPMGNSQSRSVNRYGQLIRIEYHINRFSRPFSNMRNNTE